MNLTLISRGNPFVTPAGTEIFVRNLALDLAKRVDRIDLVYGEDQVCGVRGTYGEVILHPVQLSPIPYIRALDFQRKCVGLAEKIHKDFRTDAIISFGAGTFPARMFQRIHRLKYRPLLIYYAIDSMAAEYRRTKQEQAQLGVRKRLVIWLWYTSLVEADKAACRAADLILASSKDTSRTLIENYALAPARVRVVYWGVADDFALGISPMQTQEETLLHISTSPLRKGTRMFLQALAVLRKEYRRDSKSIVAGSTEASYVNLARNLKLDVEFTGRIPNSALKRYYATCRILVSPSLSEGFCLPVIEAAMFGKPSIVSNVGSLPELVEDGVNGLVVKRADVRGLADRMNSLLSDNQLHLRLSDGAKRMASRFSISATSKRLLDQLHPQ